MSKTERPNLRHASALLVMIMALGLAGRVAAQDNSDGVSALPAEQVVDPAPDGDGTGASDPGSEPDDDGWIDEAPQDDCADCAGIEPGDDGVVVDDGTVADDGTVIDVGAEVDDGTINGDPLPGDDTATAEELGSEAVMETLSAGATARGSETPAAAHGISGQDGSANCSTARKPVPFATCR